MPFAQSKNQNAAMHSRTILFVDDEEMVLRTLKRGLFEHAFSSLFASQPQEALDMVRDEEIAVVVSDLKMPEMDGITFLGKVREIKPDISRVVLTAHSQIATILAAINSGHVHRYLTKPWKLDEQLVPTLYEALELYNLKKKRNEQAAEILRKTEALTLKNAEITKMKEMAEESDQNKTRIIQHLTEEIMPFVSEVIETTYSMEGHPNPEVQETLKNLHEQGMDVMSLLLKVKALISG